MKISVKQMFDWNNYAFCAEDVDAQYLPYFKGGMWWQLGNNNFIQVYDNVRDFKICADNFAKYGELSIKQQLQLVPVPWEEALDAFAAEMKAINVPWYVHGSAAMALHGIDVAPRDLNVIATNYSDFDRVRERLLKFALSPFERCDNWLMSAFVSLFMEARVGFAIHNKELEPYDMSTPTPIERNGDTIYVATLETLKHDNTNMNRPERVKLIEEKMNA